MSKSLGLIEVNGYLAAIEAADTALKAANVTLLGIEKVTAGIVTVKITGDVGAVKASVEAAEASAESLGLLRSVHVIARVHEDVLKMIPEFNKKENNLLEEKVEAKVKTEVKVEIEEKEDCIQEKKQSLDIKEVEKKDYSSMKVEELRRLVRSLKIPNITNKQIKFAKKDVLIDIITKYYEEGEN